jgi:hypothetical protein
MPIVTPPPERVGDNLNRKAQVVVNLTDPGCRSDGKVAKRHETAGLGRLVTLERLLRNSESIDQGNVACLSFLAGWAAG